MLCRASARYYVPVRGKQMTIDWSDPAAHNRLIERVGHDEYNRLHAEQMARSTVATVNGHAIRKVQSSRFGKLYQVGRTGTAFSAFEAAKNFASKKKGACI
jgi:hypothetical protein